MGTGKTTIGRLVATRLNREFIDTDEYLEHRFGPAKELLDQPDGDRVFRNAEESIAAELALERDLVISTGGRFFMNQKNIDTLQKDARIICLTANTEELVSRLSTATTDTYRPRFAKANNKAELIDWLIQQSEPCYQQFFKIETTGRSVEEVTQAVMAFSRQSELT